MYTVSKPVKDIFTIKTPNCTHSCNHSLLASSSNLLNNNFNNTLQQYFIEVKNVYRNKEVAF